MNGEDFLGELLRKGSFRERDSGRFQARRFGGRSFLKANFQRRMDLMGGAFQNTEFWVEFFRGGWLLRGGIFTEAVELRGELILLTAQRLFATIIPTVSAATEVIHTAGRTEKGSVLPYLAR